MDSSELRGLLQRCEEHGGVSQRLFPVPHGEIVVVLRGSVEGVVLMRLQDQMMILTDDQPSESKKPTMVRWR